MKHLLVDITAHGFGHLAQTAPVVNALRERLPNLRVTVRSAAPLAILQQRFKGDFEHLPRALDFGMKMLDAVQVDVKNSLLAYRNYHTDWNEKVRLAAREMQALNADLLLANVPYLSLAAAQQFGLPVVAMCCLNWAEIYKYYADANVESLHTYQQMLAAYNSAQVFLKVQPTMPMAGLLNAKLIAPIAHLGCKQRDEIERLCGLSANEKIVLVGMGGIDFRLPMGNWPRLPNVRWIVPAAWRISRLDVIHLEHLPMSFGDVLASSDAVLTKPGYGTFAEAAAAGVPVLYVSRGDWPEQRYLVEWIQKNGVCAEVNPENLFKGDLADALQQLWSLPKSSPPLADGAVEAAEILAKLLSA